MNNTFEKVKEIIVKKIDIDPSKVMEKTNFKNDLHADSLDVIEIVMEIEDLFDIEFSDEEASKINTVEDVVWFIESQK